MIAAFLSLKVESVVLEVVINPDSAHAASIRNQVFGYGRIILHERLASLERIQILWRQLAERHGLSISQWGLPALAGFSFESYNTLAYKTLIAQEMLAKGFLAANSIYSCIKHIKKIQDCYIENLDPIFKIISGCENGRRAADLLKGPVCHGSFKRLN